MIRALVACVVVSLWVAPLWAKVFRNSYVSFELPDRWECKLEGTEYLCSSLVKEASREAVIVLTAKELGPSDSFEIYEQFLKTPKKSPGSDGKPRTSTVNHVRRRNISNQPWVDGMHLGSEIPNYYTRYLATIKDKIAVLVTFSAHQRHFTKYSSDFFKAIESLQVVAAPDILKGPGAAPIRPGSETLGLPGQGALVDPGALESEPYPEEPTGGSNNTVLALILILAGVGGFLFMRAKKKKQ